MQEKHFYFLTDQYFMDFPDQFLMKNKEMLDGKLHDRPCFYAFQDMSTGLYWMIPFSSRVQKYDKVYQQKIQANGQCDTIIFGEVLGHRKAFLIQNMCPVTLEYIHEEYIDSHTQNPVRIPMTLEKTLITNAKKVLRLQRNGIRLIFPDVLEIEQKLILQSKSCPIKETSGGSNSSVK